MKKPLELKCLIVLALGLALVFAPGFAPKAQAAAEDVAMFYEELGQHGEWVDYENYGPVWYPTQVDQDWRPYTNGRWVPTEQGYVFETAEPWGWATYHYGNWMPTDLYGWCWVPNSTWYPSTVAWRTSPETAPPDTAYVGWAPVPPPNYVPPPPYYPPGGYTPGTPVTDLITAPFWIFSQAASFLLGLGQPFVPTYSYVGCGCLAPPAYIPTFFPQTVFAPVYMTPTWYPPVMAVGIGSYLWGPPTPWIARWGGHNTTVINNVIHNNTVNITKITNITNTTIINKNTHIRNITPKNLVDGKALPPPKHVDAHVGKTHLGQNIVKVKDAPKLTAAIPKAPKVPPSAITGTPGATLPGKATQKITPAMAGKIEKLSPKQQIKGTLPPAKTGALPGVKPPPGVKPMEKVPGVKPTEKVPGIKPPPGVKPMEKVPGVKPTEKVPGIKPPPGIKPMEKVPGVKPTEKVPGIKPPPGIKPMEKVPGVKPTEKVPGIKPPPGVKPREKAGVPLPPGFKDYGPEKRKALEKEHQMLQKGKAPITTTPTPKMTPPPKATIAPKATPTPKATIAPKATPAPKATAAPKMTAPPKAVAAPKAAPPPAVKAPPKEKKTTP